MLLVPKIPKVEEKLPRHARLGIVSPVQVNPPAIHEIEEIIPVVDDNGVVVSQTTVVKCVPVKESMAVYKHGDFDIENLEKAGVKLSEINVNFGSLDFQDRVLDRAKSLELLGESAIDVISRRQQIEDEIKNVVEPLKDVKNE